MLQWPLIDAPPGYDSGEANHDPEANLRHGRIQVTTSARLFSALGLRFNPTGAYTSFHALSVAP